jgi:hypothetical protein
MRPMITGLFQSEYEGTVDRFRAMFESPEGKETLSLRLLHTAALSILGQMIIP